MIWLILAFFLGRVQLKLGEKNYGTPFNGIGAVDRVNQRQADAPTAYRVLLPWLIAAVERLWPPLRRHRLALLYEPFKVGSMALLLALMAHVLGQKVALIFAALIPATFHYDYWDWPLETMAIVAGMSGEPLLALAACLPAALARETAVLGAVAYFCATLDYHRAMLIALSVLCLQMAVRLYVGHKPNYWQARMWEVNWRDVIETFDNHPFYFGEIVLALLITAATLMTVVTGLAGPTWPVPIAILLACWTLARVSEVRVLSSCLVYVALAAQTFI